MIARLPLRGRSPHPTLHQLIERHGAISVTLALMVMLIGTPARRRKKRIRSTAVRDLSPHLRRDIGLPPYHEPGPRHWDHM